MLKVSDIDKIQKQYENVTEKIISLREEVSESRNDTETEYVSVEDLLNLLRTVSNIRNLISEIQNINNEENVIIALGQRKKTDLILMDEVYIEQAFPYLPSISTFGYNTFRDNH